MLQLLSGIVIGILLSFVAVLAGKRFSGFINSEKSLFDKEEKGYIVKLEPDLDKILKQ